MDRKEEGINKGREGRKGKEKEKEGGRKEQKGYG